MKPSQLLSSVLAPITALTSGYYGSATGDQSVLSNPGKQTETSHAHPIGKVHELPFGVADVIAEYTTMTTEDGEIISGTLLHPNPHRDLFNTTNDFGNKGDFKFLPDRKFSDIMLTFAPMIPVAIDDDGTELYDFRAQVKLDDFEPLTLEQMGNSTFRQECQNEVFTGNVTLMPSYSCPESSAPGTYCVKIIPTTIEVAGSLREAMSRVYYGWEKDPNFLSNMTFGSNPLASQLVYVHMQDPEFRIEQVWDTADDGNEGRKLVGSPGLVATESMGPQKDVQPGTAKRAWSGWFFSLVPAGWPETSKEERSEGDDTAVKHQTVHSGSATSQTGSIHERA